MGIKCISEKFSSRNMKVMVFGSFDKLHDGHRALFAQAQKHGEVYAVLSRDESIRRLKKREPRMSEQERLALVQAEPSVHKALLGAVDDFFRHIGKFTANKTSEAVGQ